MGGSPRTEQQLSLAFDYGDMPKRAAAACESDANAICEMELKGLALIVEQGRRLKAVQDRLAHHGDGGFRKWIAARCPFSHMSAYKRIAVSGTFGGFVKELDKPPVIEMEAAYLLSRESTPSEAAEEAKQRLSDGKPVSYADAKQIVAAIDGTSNDAGEAFDMFEATDQLHRKVKAWFLRWPAALRDDFIQQLTLALETIKHELPE